MNKVMLIGNVGRDAELTYTPTGSAVAKFSMAVNRQWTDKTSGEKKEETIWFTITAWERLAETASQYIRKGTKLFVEGRLAPPRAYMDKNNQPQAQVEVIATNFELLTPKGGDGSTTGGGNAPAPSNDELGGQDFPF